MSQIHFDKEYIRGEFTYIATDDETGERIELDWSFGDFETFIYYMKAYIEKDFSKVMDGCDGISDVQLIGISFSAKNQDASTRIDMFEDWLRATTYFDLDKFNTNYEDKMKRIMAIIKE